MHHRIQALSGAIAVIATAISALVAALAAALPEIPGNPFQGPAILDDERFRLITMVGALFGAMVNLGLYPLPPVGVISSPVGSGVRAMVWKVFCSAVVGVVFTPIEMHWFGMVPNVDNLILVSFLTAIGGLGLLRSVLPLIPKIAAVRLGLASRLGASESNSSPENMNPNRETKL